VATLFRGFNAGVTFSVVHDSYLGWYDVATPAISYTFSPHYSADASVSIYPYRLAQNQRTVVPANERLIATHADAGDTLLGLHGYFSPHALQNTLTAALTLPSGNRATASARAELPSIFATTSNATSVRPASSSISASAIRPGCSIAWSWTSPARSARSRTSRPA
jgi:hypothetical protein